MCRIIRDGDVLLAAGKRFDIVFLDIQMEGTDGIETAKMIKGIKLDARGFMLSDAVTIKAYDMGIILNNGLDNAIEACSGHPSFGRAMTREELYKSLDAELEENKRLYGKTEADWIKEQCPNWQTMRFYGE